MSNNLDLALDYLGGINKPTIEQVGFFARVDSTGRNLEYVDAAQVDFGDGLEVGLFPVEHEAALEVAISEAKTAKVTIAIEDDTITTFGYHVTGRDTSSNLYRKQGAIITTRAGGGAAVDRSGEQNDMGTPYNDLTGATVDVEVSGNNLVISTTGDTTSATKWWISVWRAVQTHEAA